MVFRWALLGTGRICQDFASALSASENGVVYAVGSRDLQSAQSFIGKYGGSKAYGSYDEVISDPDVDIIYVGTPQHLHLELTLKALRSKKAVLCEKPLTLNLRDAEAAIACAKENQTFLMEAVWMNFWPLIRKTKELLQSGAIGRVKMVTSNYGWKNDFDSNSSIGEAAFGGGGLLAVGCYTLGIALHAVDADVPVEVKATGELNDKGVDLQVAAQLKFGSDQFVSTECSLVANLPGDARIIGTNGSIHLHFPFLCPIKITLHVDGSEPLNFESPAPSSEQTFNFIHSSGLLYEAEAVHDCLRQGLIECPEVSHSWTLRTIRIVDEIRRQVGVKFMGDVEDG
eukprot:GILK01001818.1.p1 GENE.GILK01001818.1~~GILK01001818.1.p1  ORF type:complete len:342 (+),score=47.26 GILK01001818.1:48-1073(+)